MRRLTLVLSAIILIVLGVGCSSSTGTPIPTSLPLEHIPTVVQQTLNAGQTATPSATATLANTLADFPPLSPTPSNEAEITQSQYTPTPLANEQTATISPTPSATRTPDLSATSPPRSTRTPTITRTPTTPPGGVQINSPGPMSRVVSPLELTGNIHTVSLGQLPHRVVDRAAPSGW